jgi:hypothetical protein
MPCRPRRGQLLGLAVSTRLLLLLPGAFAAGPQCSSGAGGGGSDCAAVWSPADADGDPAGVATIHVAPPPISWTDSAASDGTACWSSLAFQVVCPDPRAALWHAHTLPAGVIPQLKLAPGRWTITRPLPTITRSLALLGAAEPRAWSSERALAPSPPSGVRGRPFPGGADDSGFDPGYAAGGQGILQVRETPSWPITWTNSSLLQLSSQIPTRRRGPT